jgi:hypothetical protein
MTDFASMPGPALVKAFNEMAPKLNLNPVKKFRTRGEGVARCEKAEAALTSAPSKPKTEKKPRSRTANGVRIAVEAEKNPKREGSRAAKAFAEMTKYLEGHPQCSLQEVIENTTYRMGDYNWDLDHKFIRKV